MQPPKALDPMLVTLLGMSMEAKLLQLLKTPVKNFVTLLGIVTDVKRLQLLNV